MAAGTPSSNSSLTSTESFQLRAQHSERRRAQLLAVVLASVVALTLIRRMMGGTVMAHNAVFYPYLAILAAGIAYQVFMVARLRAYIREGRIVARWRWVASAMIDMAVPLGMLAVAHWNSPRGEMAALSSPVILLIPIVLVLSILRLKPLFTLYSGLAAAAAHMGLAVLSVADTHADVDQIPVVMSYGVLLALTGIAGALTAREVRRYVVEGAEDSAAHERDRAALERVERDLSVAREIQMGLLPKGKPDLAGYDIVGMNRPADQTGGDYYDWQKLSDGRLAVVMADVTGHGIGPALVMAVCRAYARASVAIATEPEALMRRLNDLLHDDLSGAGGRFITLAIALLDTAGRVNLVSAGHGPSLWYRAAEKDVVIFGGDGLPLAIMPEESYGPSQGFHLSTGDVLVLLTDGYFEYQNGAKEQYGVERLCAELKKNAAGDSAAILKALDDSVRVFAAGASQDDDMTAVVIKRA